MRTIQGRFLLRPSDELNELVIGVLGRAQEKYAMAIHGFVAMGNHVHLLCSPRHAAHLAAFMGFVASNIAREAGRLHDWRERFWRRRYVAIVVADETAQVARLKYILRNGCGSWAWTRSLRKIRTAGRLTRTAAPRRRCMHRPGPRAMGSWRDTARSWMRFGRQPRRCAGACARSSSRCTRFRRHCRSRTRRRHRREVSAGKALVGDRAVPGPRCVYGRRCVLGPASRLLRSWWEAGKHSKRPETPRHGLVAHISVVTTLVALLVPSSFYESPGTSLSLSAHDISAGFRRRDGNALPFVRSVGIPDIRAIRHHQVDRIGGRDGLKSGTSNRLVKIFAAASEEPTSLEHSVFRLRCQTTASGCDACLDRKHGSSVHGQRREHDVLWRPVFSRLVDQQDRSVRVLGPVGSDVHVGQPTPPWARPQGRGRPGTQIGHPHRPEPLTLHPLRPGTSHHE